jgi:hypothetical protein
MFSFRKQIGAPVMIAVRATAINYAKGYFFAGAAAAAFDLGRTTIGEALGTMNSRDGAERGVAP